jgi:hypothetical protein
MLEGAPLMKKWFKYFGRNIIRGGIKSPAALTDAAAGTKYPPSAALRAPI